MPRIPTPSRRTAPAPAASFPRLPLAACLAVFLTALVPILPPPGAATAVATAAEPAYLDQKALDRALEALRKQSDRVTVEQLAETPGGRPVRLVTIAPAKGADGAEDAPAVLVVGDPLGTTPLATRAAVDLCRLLLHGDAAAGDGGAGDGDDDAAPPTWAADELTWYVVPALDPDGAARFFAEPRLQDGRNDRPVDDDKDGASGEDGPDDLDGDGAIAAMLVRHPDGGWLLGEADEAGLRLPREADAAKGERGLYRMETEGGDDDGDGRRNEDGPGGVTPGRNFPHAYEHWTDDGGPWAASEPESRALLGFAFDHPGIGLVLVLGRANTLLQVPESNRQAEAGGGKYKVPEWMARRVGLDPEQEFTLDQLVQMARDFTGRKDLTAEDVMGFLELGAAVNPNRRDLAWWNALSERYKEGLKEAGLDGERLDPPGSGRASVEEWGYYQFGVPSLAVDFWSVPKPQKEKKGKGEGAAGEAGEEPLTPDRIEKMSRDEFLALGEERIAAFLKDNDAPPGVTAQMLIGALNGGMLTPEKIAKMMRERAEKKESGGADPELEALAAFAAAHPEADAWRPWTEVALPDGREALVGGPAPFARRTPPPAMVDSLLAPQLPLLTRLTGWLPRLEIAAVEVEPRGGDVWQVTAWIANRGRIPYPTFQGKRTRRPGPVVVTLEGGEVLEGRARETIDQVEGLGAQSRRWLVRAPRGADLTVTASAPGAGRAARTFEPQREGGQR